MTRNTIMLALLAAILATTGGCATMTRGTTQCVAFNSSPAGATVIVDGMGRGQTPMTIALSRGCDHSGEISMPGYESAAFNITRRPTGAIAGNILFGGLIGLGVDAVSGANNDLAPDSIYVTLHSNQYSYNRRE